MSEQLTNDEVKRLFLGIDRRLKNVTTDTEISGVPIEKRLSDDQIPLQLSDVEDSLTSLGALSSKKIIELLNKNELEAKHNRVNRYKRMSYAQEHPEIEGALNIYADEATTEDENGDIIHILHPDKKAKETVDDMFERIGGPTKLWQIAWNMCGFGDDFYHAVISKNTKHVINLNWLPREAIERVEINGVLKGFKVNEDNLGEAEAVKFNYYSFKVNKLSGRSEKKPGQEQDDDDLIYPYQILHFKIPATKYGVYGKSVIDSVVGVIDKLTLMEKAMLIQRVTRAAERRLYYIGVGQLQGEKAIRYANDAVGYLKKKKKLDTFLDPKAIDLHKDVFGTVEDIVIPFRPGEEGHKIDTLPQMQSVDPTDVEFIRDRLFPGIAIPRQYIYDDTFANANLNLSSKSVPFAKRIVRVQRFLLFQLYKLATIELKLQGFSNDVIENLTILMNNPSSIAEKEKIEIETLRWGLISQVASLNTPEKVLYPDMLIYKDMMNLDDAKIIELLKLAQAQQFGLNPFNVYDVDDRPEGSEDIVVSKPAEGGEGAGGGPGGIPPEAGEALGPPPEGEGAPPPPKEAGGGAPSPPGGETADVDPESDKEPIMDDVDETPTNGNKNIMLKSMLEKKKGFIAKMKSLQETVDSMDESSIDDGKEKVFLQTKKPTRRTTSILEMTYSGELGGLDKRVPKPRKKKEAFVEKENK